jgi:hypothetical protein
MTRKLLSAAVLVAAAATMALAAPGTASASANDIGTCKSGGKLYDRLPGQGKRTVTYKCSGGETVSVFCSWRAADANIWFYAYVSAKRIPGWILPSAVTGVKGVPSCG